MKNWIEKEQPSKDDIQSLNETLKIPAFICSLLLQRNINSLEKAIQASKSDSSPYIIGGGEIYKQALAIADRVELTRVHAHFEGDTFFPDLDLSQWKESNNKFIHKDEDHAFDFSFITYKRQ